jgi:L-asparagine transporter-like permease
MEKKHKGLSVWQLTMMALGTVVGGSFFLGSAVAIRAAGSAVIISFILGGVLVYFILFALSELTVSDPAPGSFRTFATRAFGPGTGFVVGWVYWTGLVLAMSSEATAVSILLRGWFPGISMLLAGSLIITGITFLNLLGADRLSKLESGLAAVKLFAIAAFVILGLFLIAGLMPGVPQIGLGELIDELWFPGGISGIAGSMLIVIFTYAGFEIIGLAASESNDAPNTIPRAITYTVLGLISLYVASVAVILPLIPTASLTEKVSPLVAALNRWGIGWAGNIINIVLITAILSTMLAAMFGLGRMISSLAHEGQAPVWLINKSNVPYRGILFSGVAMIMGLGLGFSLPRQVYLFLISSGGFSLLFTYAVILATHYRFRKKHGCPPLGKCQMPGFPFSSLIALISTVAIIASMPLIPGQRSGLLAGLVLVALYTVIYLAIKYLDKITKPVSAKRNPYYISTLRARLNTELAEELGQQQKIESKTDDKKQ